MSEERESVLKIVVDATEAKKRLTENVAALEKNKAELALLNKALKDNRKAYEEGRLSLEEYETASTEVAQKIVETQKEVRLLSQESRTLQKALDAPIGSLNDQRAQLTQLLGAYDNFVVGVDGTEEELKSLEAEIQKVTKAVGGQEDATGRAQRKVGSYEDAIKKALSANNDINGSIGQTVSVFNQAQDLIGKYNAALKFSTDALGNFTDTLKNTDLSAKGLAVSFTNLAKTTLSLNSALKLLRLAFIAIPIVALLTALAALVSFFTSTQQGADLLSRALNPLKVAFEKLIGILQEFGKSIFENVTKAFDDPVQAVKDFGNAILENIENRFKSAIVLMDAFSEALKGNFKNAAKLGADAAIQFATGITNGTDKIEQAIDAVSDFIDETVKQANKLTDLSIAVEKAEIRLIRVRQELNAAIKEQQAIAQDVTKSEEERIAAAEKALQLSKQLQKEEQAFVDLQVKKLELEQSFNDTDNAGQKEYAELLARRSELQKQGIEQQNQLTRLTNQLTRERNALERQLSAQELKDREQALQQRLAAEKLSFEDRIALLKDLNDTQIALERKTQADIVEDITMSERRKQIAITESNRNILQLEGEFTAQEKELRKQQAQSNADFRAMVLELERTAFEQQFAINAEYGAATLKQNNELYNAELSALAARYEAEQLAAQGNAEQLLLLSKEYDLALTDAAAKEAQRRKAIRQAEFKQQSDVVNATRDLLGTLSQAFGQSTAASKVLAKTNATLAYIQELQNIAASAQSPLFAPNLVTGGAAGAAIQTVQTVAATGRYIANIATIAQAGAGGDFVTSKPTMLLVGEAGRERVQVTPLGARGTTIIPPSSGLRRTPENDLIARRSGNQQQVREVQVPVLVVEDYQRTANRVQIAEKRANGNR